MLFEEWAERNINTNQSAYTAAKAGWKRAMEEVIAKLRELADEESTIEYKWAAEEIRSLMPPGF